MSNLMDECFLESQGSRFRNWEDLKGEKLCYCTLDLVDYTVSADYTFPVDSRASLAQALHGCEEFALMYMANEVTYMGHITCDDIQWDDVVIFPVGHTHTINSKMASCRHYVFRQLQHDGDKYENEVVVLRYIEITQIPLTYSLDLGDGVALDFLGHVADIDIALSIPSAEAFDLPCEVYTLSVPHNITTLDMMLL